MAAFVFIDKDAVRSTCAIKAEVLKFILWVSARQQRKLGGVWSRSKNETH